MKALPRENFSMYDEEDHVPQSWVRDNIGDTRSWFHTYALDGNDNTEIAKGKQSSRGKYNLIVNLFVDKRSDLWSEV